MNDAMGLPQTAVVLGGTSEIARATLRALVPLRLRKVVLAGRDEGSLEVAAKEIRSLGAEAHTMLFDVTDATGHDTFAAEAAGLLGQIDLVLVAAGVLGEQSRDETDPAAVAGVLQTNCTGPAAAMTALASVLRAQGQGRIVVLSSVAGVRIRRSNYVYGASKAGLDAFAQGLAASLEGSGASLMIVRPGWVATRMTEGLRPAPFATTPDAVAADILTGLRRGSAVVWSPAPLKLVFAIFRLLPGALWRRMPA